MGKTAVIFPGQGAQSVGMCRDVVDASSAARAVFDQAAAVLGFDLADVCFNGPADRLNATDVSQPAIYTASIAVWQAIQERPDAAGAVRPDATAGLSLGEYTSLWLAGRLAFEDGLRLVQQRGRFMQEAAEQRRGSMVSVMGLTDEQLEIVAREAAGDGVLVAANFNSPGQVVLSGDAAACERALPVIEARGGRGVPLRVAGAFHSPLMAPAADRLSAVLEATPIAAAGIPVVSNVTADYHRDPAEVRTLLRDQVVRPVRWHASVSRLIADGFDRFVEVGPGRVLTGLMRGINRQVQAVNVSTAAAIEKLAGETASAAG